MDIFVQSTVNSDGSADFTLTFAEDSHRFTVYGDDDTAYVEYEETLSWRGGIHTGEPNDDIYKMLMTSDEMSRFLDENGFKRVRRERY